MVHTVHRGRPGKNAPSATEIFHMATAAGARTTGFSEQIGQIRVGHAADLVLINWDDVAGPYMDAQTPVLEAVLRRVGPEVAGRAVCRELGEGYTVIEGRNLGYVLYPCRTMRVCALAARTADLVARRRKESP